MPCPYLTENYKGDSTDRSWYPYICDVTGRKISSDEEYKHCDYSSDYENCRAYKEREDY